MKNTTFRELLNLIYERKQPNKVYLSGTYFGGANVEIEWEWDSVDEEYYYRNSKNFNKVYTEGTTLEEVVSDIYTAKQLAEDKIIHLYDEILDDKEKEYLSRIIKPFKMYLISITKEERADREMIIIRYKDYMDRNIDRASILRLPTFKKGTMYNGMQTDKQYTLEELGI